MNEYSLLSRRKTIPITVVDDFFSNPYTLVDFAEKQEFESSHFYPGTRTKCVSSLNYTIYDEIVLGILSIFSRDEVTEYVADMYFQKIPADFGRGWVHRDPNLITAVINLNNTNSLTHGTSIFEKIDILQDNGLEAKQLSNRKASLIEQEKYEDYISLGAINNKPYKKTVDISGVFNRLICFDANLLHAADSFDTKNGKDRLVLLVFMKKVSFRNDSLPLQSI